jgi:hypothetical protein
MGGGAGDRLLTRAFRLLLRAWGHERIRAAWHRAWTCRARDQFSGLLETFKPTMTAAKEQVAGIELRSIEAQPIRLSAATPT